MYIGNVKKIIDPSPSYVLGIDNKFTLETLEYSPGLCKIIDEVIVNARDQYVKHPDLVTAIKISITKKGDYPVITVFNNGVGFDIYYDQTLEKYSVELVLTKPRSGDNFDDDKTTGGKFGFGVKATNAFSLVFRVETVDATNKKKYTQQYKKNLSVIEAPAITNSNLKYGYTKISFAPDFKRFGMETLEPATIKLIKKRAYDLAACVGASVKVTFDDEYSGSSDIIQIKRFQDYAQMYLPDGADIVSYDNQESYQWVICVANSVDAFNQVSFVNGILTRNGGTHVNYITAQIVRFVKEKIANRKDKEAFSKVTPAMIKGLLFVFVNATIVGPSFNSQSKEMLSTEPRDFGSKCEIPPDILEKIVQKLEILVKCKALSDAKNKIGLEKTSGKKRSRVIADKYDTAVYAGSSSSELCTLILTEGDSAKGMAKMGLSEEQKKYYGIFPLRGKVLNVRNKGAKEVSNEELITIKKILGLTHGKVYDSTADLRYGHILIMTDADVDGSHIKGLIMNFIHVHWPSLIVKNNFINAMITPILKVSKGTGAKKQVLEFYTQQDYDLWKSIMSANDLAHWDVKYYKGLGTSDKDEAIDYFSRLDELTRKYIYVGKLDDDYIRLAFENSLADKRKEWLMKRTEEPMSLDVKNKEIRYKDFIDKDLVNFSLADNQRSIPSMVDGLKPSTRKIIYTALKIKMREEKKVVTFVGKIMEMCCYHHGDKSLSDSIVGLAQNFVGTNNIELLYPAGNFGTRVSGPKVHAQPRYINTYLAKLTEAIFHPDDMDILKYLDEDGVQIEPEYFVPILPMILCNGADGIGTGFSTNVPCYNPLELAMFIRQKITGAQVTIGLKPWFRDFIGDVVYNDSKNECVILGKYELHPDKRTILITELPIGVWTDDYKSFLASLIDSAEIKDFIDLSSDNTIKITLMLTQQQFDTFNKMQKAQIITKLKLGKKMSMRNMWAYSATGKMTKYTNVYDLIADYCKVRLEYYSSRKASLLAKLTRQLQISRSKIMFINAVRSGEIITSKPKAELIMQIANFSKFTFYVDSEKTPADKNPADDDSGPGAGGYNYLISQPIYSLTNEKRDALAQVCADLDEQYKTLINTTENNMWITDLDNFIKMYKKWEAENIVIAKKQDLKKNKQLPEKPARKARRVNQ